MKPVPCYKPLSRMRGDLIEPSNDSYTRRRLNLVKASHASEQMAPVLKEDGQSQRVMPVENTMNDRKTYRSLDQSLVVHLNGKG